VIVSRVFPREVPFDGVQQLFQPRRGVPRRTPHRYCIAFHPQSGLQVFPFLHQFMLAK